MGTKLSKQKHEKRLKLYYEGYNDTEIANKLGLHHTTIYEWRKVHNLPANFNYPSLAEEVEKIIISLNKQGVSDYKIAKLLGTTWAKGHYWRKKLDLPTVVKKGESTITISPTGDTITHIDKLGRIRLPRDMRMKLSINLKDKVEIFKTEDNIAIKKYLPLCCICNKSLNEITFKGNNLCRRCINKIKSLSSD